MQDADPQYDTVDNILLLLIPEKVPSVCSQRWILAYILSAGFFFVYALRVNISVALVCMVKTPVTNSSVLASTQNNNTQDDQCGELQVQSFNENQASILHCLSSYPFYVCVTK